MGNRPWWDHVREPVLFVCPRFLAGNFSRKLSSTKRKTLLKKNRFVHIEAPRTPLTRTINAKSACACTRHMRTLYVRVKTEIERTAYEEKKRIETSQIKPNQIKSNQKEKGEKNMTVRKSIRKDMCTSRPSDSQSGREGGGWRNKSKKQNPTGKASYEYARAHKRSKKNKRSKQEGERKIEIKKREKKRE